jgi:hypothetical protein
MLVYEYVPNGTLTDWLRGKYEIQQFLFLFFQVTYANNKTVLEFAKEWTFGLFCFVFDTCLMRCRLKVTSNFRLGQKAPGSSGSSSRLGILARQRRSTHNPQRCKIMQHTAG